MISFACSPSATQITADKDFKALAKKLMPAAPKETGVATSSAAHAKISAESEAGGGLRPSAPLKSAPGSSYGRFDIDDGTVLADLVAPRKKEKGADASVEPSASKHDYFSIEHFGFIVLDRKRKQFNAHCACRGKASPEGLAIGDASEGPHYSHDAGVQDERCWKQKTFRHVGAMAPPRQGLRHPQGALG